MWPVILIAVLAAFAALAGFFLMTIRRIARPTRGEAIAQDADSSALLVIDMQEDFTRSEGANAYDPAERDRAIARVNDLVARARAAGQPVALIRQEHRGRAVQLVASLLLGGAGNPGRPGGRLDRDLDAQGCPAFVKHVADTFSAPELDAYLREHNVRRLTLTGLDLAHCVRGTALGARNRGYEVIVDLAGTLSASEASASRVRGELEAAGVIFVDAGRVSLPQHPRTDPGSARSDS